MDREVARIAGRQHGVVTRAQLLAAGLTHAMIVARLGTGRLIAVHRGVYRVGHTAPSVHADYLAAVLACGTGACAAVVAGIRRGLLDSPVRVSARGGELSIAWAGEGEPVYLSGPAVTVFEGEIEIED